MNGATATLYNSSGNTAVLLDAFDQPIVPMLTANDTTGRPGYYEFKDLLPSQYVV